MADCGWTELLLVLVNSRLVVPVQTVDATPSGIKLFFKGGVYATRKTVWTFRGAEVRRVATLEGGADAA
jgi:hypothetical protein